MLIPQNQEARWLSQGSTQDGPQGEPNVLHEQEDASKAPAPSPTHLLPQRPVDPGQGQATALLI